jgi:hypothetical protein
LEVKNFRHSQYKSEPKARVKLNSGDISGGYVRRQGMDGRGLAETIFTKTLGCIMTTEFHGEGPEGEGMCESCVRENLTHGSMRGNWKNK